MHSALHLYGMPPASVCRRTQTVCRPEESLLRQRVEEDRAGDPQPGPGGIGVRVVREGVLNAAISFLLHHGYVCVKRPMHPLPVSRAVRDQQVLSLRSRVSRETLRNPHTPAMGSGWTACQTVLQTHGGPDMIFDSVDSLPPSHRALYWRMRDVQRAALMVLLFFTVLSLLIKEPTTASILVLTK